MDPLAWFGPYLNAGATAVMTALVVWFVTRGFPSLLDRADQREDKLRAYFEAEAERDRKVFRDTIAETSSAMREIAAEARANRCRYQQTGNGQ